MNNNLIDKQDPRVADLFRRLAKIHKTLDKLETTSSRTFNGQRFLTDKELSGIFRISRRTLQDYRTSGIIPYYLICGKILYEESEIQRFLEDGRKRSIEEQELI